MVYDLTKYAGHEVKLFFGMVGEEAERHGSICTFWCDMERGNCDGMKQFGRQPHMETQAFMADVKRVINYLRGNDMKYPPLRSQQDFAAFCCDYSWGTLKGDGENVPSAFGVKIQTDGYTYYLRCHPLISTMNIHAYNNHYLLPELAGKHELPDWCYSTAPHSGELVVITRGERGYLTSDKSTSNEKDNRLYANCGNVQLGLTKGQVEAMLAGSMFGWNTPVAKPWNYNQDGIRRPMPPKKSEPAR